MGLSLMRSHLGPDDRADEGRHFFSYALLPHAGPFAVESVARPSYEFNYKPVVRSTTSFTADIPSLVTVDRSNAIIESVKWAEKGQAFVVRLYEAEKQACRITVSYGFPVTSVTETNMLEENPGKLSLKAGCVRISLRPFEIKTLRCEVKT